MSADAARKLIVLAGFSSLWLIVSIMRAPESVGRNSDINVDTSSFVALPEALHQDYISGRDFQFQYGPLSQVLTFAGSWFHKPWSPLDALPLILLTFFFASTGLFALVLFLIKQLDWKHCTFIYLCAAGLNLFSEPTSFRPLALLLCAVGAYRVVNSGSRRAMLTWSAATGFMCIVAQLITIELGLYGVAAALSILGAEMLIGLWCPTRAISAHRARILVIPAALIGITYVAGNILISALFTLSSPNYAHFFDYQRYALELIRSYPFTAGVPWGLASGPTLGLAVMAMFTAAACVLLILKFDSVYGSLLLSLFFASLVSLKSAFVRSDLGHITQSASPLVLTFVVIGALFFANVRPAKKPAIFWTVVFGSLWFSWPWAGAYVAHDILNAATHSPYRKLKRLRNVTSTAEEILPSKLAAAMADATGRPMLAFPHDNYIPVKLQRRMLAPALQSFLAGTSGLQRFYVGELERNAQTLDVIYGMDGVATPVLESVQAITRTPIIFDYLYRHFGLASNVAFGQGFYLLRHQELNRDFDTADVSFETKKMNDRAIEITAAVPSKCSLLKLDLRIDYPLAVYLGRPTAVDLTFFHEGTAFLKTGAVAADPHSAFYTYVSLIPAAEFYKVFGRDPVPSQAWDKLRIETRPSDWIGVSYSAVQISKITCIT